MGLIKIVFTIIAILVLAVVGIGAYLYFTDYQAQATITDKGSDANGPFVVVTPKLLPRTHFRQAVPSDMADFVCVGYQVLFHMNTHTYRVFDQAQTVVYDSATGQKNIAAAARCASGGVIG